MKWSFRIATIAGTEVRVHATFLLLLIWVGLSVFLVGGVSAALGSIVFICAVFLCVLLHEFGHVLTAKHYGIATPDVTLLPIGGLARMKTMPKRPYQELIIALAGPAVNIVIALLLIAVVGPSSLSFGDELKIGDLRAILPQLAILNVWLAVFNLIPAFPMDGGRVLRAMLATVIDHGRATDIAARTGQALAIMGGIVGLTIGHPILVIIAIFIYLGAAQENASSMMHEVLDGLPVEKAMLTEFVALGHRSTVSDATKALLAGSQQHFPVVDSGNRLLGLATRHDIIAALAEHGMSHPIVEVMRSCDEALSVKASTIDALEALQGSDSPVLPVIDPSSDQLAGLVTAENVAEMIMVMTALRRLSARKSGTNSPLLKDGEGFKSAALRTKEATEAIN